MRALPARRAPSRAHSRGRTAPAPRPRAARRAGWSGGGSFGCGRWSRRSARRSAGPRPCDGSSRSRRSGCAIRPRPRATICCSPPDKRSGELLAPLAEHGEQREHGLHPLARCPRAARRYEPSSRFSATRERREDPPPLGHMRDAERGALMRGERRHVPPPELDAPGRAADRPRDGPQQRGLARAVRPDDGDELPLGRPRGRRPRARGGRRRRR